MKRKFVSLLLLFIPLFAKAANENLSHIRIHPRKGTVAVTFDDGPNPKYTPQILDILDSYHIKATFFVVGQFAKRYPDLIKEIHARGHVIANHSMTHPYLTQVYGKRLYDEVVQPNVIVKSIIGVTPVCLRPPFGLSNERVRSYIRSQGMRVVMWDLNSFDYKRQPVSQLVQWVVTNTKPGYDLLLHDGSGNSFQTVKALPAIIEGLQKRGIGFDVICEPPKQP